MADEQQQAQAVEYRAEHHQINTVERTAKFDAALEHRAREGWRIHTFDTSSHPDIDVLWHRPAAHGTALSEAQARVQELEAEVARLRAYGAS